MTAVDWMIAIHEAGHAVVGAHLGRRILAVELHPCEVYGGWVHFSEGPAMSPRAQALLSVAGDSAMELIRYRASLRHGQRPKRRRHLHDLAERCGGTLRDLRDLVCAGGDMQRIVDEGFGTVEAVGELACEAAAILRPRMAAVRALADELILRRRLEARDIAAILRRSGHHDLLLAAAVGRVLPGAAPNAGKILPPLHQVLDAVL